MSLGVDWWVYEKEKLGGHYHTVTLATRKLTVSVMPNFPSSYLCTSGQLWKTQGQKTLLLY